MRWQPPREVVYARAGGFMAGSRVAGCWEEGGKGGWRSWYRVCAAARVVGTLMQGCSGMHATPSRALLSPTSIAGNRVRGERHSVGSRQEKVCVMEVMEGSDLAVPPSLQPSRCVWCLHSCKQACDSFEEFWCTHWDGPRGGVGAGARWHGGRLGLGAGDLHRGRRCGGAFQKRFKWFIFGSSGVNK